MATLKLVRNIILAFSLVLMVIILGIYLWEPKINTTVSEVPVTVTTDIRILTGVISQVTADSIELTLNNPPPILPENLHTRTVVLSPEVLIQRQVLKDPASYEKEVSEFQDGLARAAMINEKKASTSISAEVTTVPGETLSTTTAINQTEGEEASLEVPSPFMYSTTTEALLPGMDVTVFSDDLIFYTPLIRATRIIIGS